MLLLGPVTGHAKAKFNGLRIYIGCKLGKSDKLQAKHL